MSIANPLSPAGRELGFENPFPDSGGSRVAPVNPLDTSSQALRAGNPLDQSEQPLHGR